MEILIISWGVVTLFLIFIMLHGFDECEKPYINIDEFKEKQQ